MVYIKSRFFLSLFLLLMNNVLFHQRQLHVISTHAWILESATLKRVKISRVHVQAGSQEIFVRYVSMQPFIYQICSFISFDQNVKYLDSSLNLDCQSNSWHERQNK